VPFGTCVNEEEGSTTSRGGSEGCLCNRWLLGKRNFFRQTGVGEFAGQVLECPITDNDDNRGQ